MTDAKIPLHIRRLLKAAVTFILLLSAAWVRLYQLGGESLWHDEAFTWWFARLPWREMLDTVRLDGVNPPIYYLAVKPFLLFFGESETALRMLSAAAGVLTVVLALKLGEMLAGSIGGFAAGWFWAFHPMAIWFSRDARPYALAVFFAISLLYLFIVSRDDPPLGIWGLSFLVLTLGQLTHYFFFLVGGVLVLLALLQIGKNPHLFRGWALTAVAGFIPLAAWISWYFNQPNPSLGIGWIQRPILTDLPLTFWNLISGYGGVLTAAPLLFGLVNVLFIGLSMAKREDPKLVRGMLVIGLLLPLAAVWVVSQRRPVYVDRYFIILLPLVSVLVAFGAKKAVDRLAPFLLAGPDAYLPLGVLLVMLAFGNWLGWQVHLEPAYRNEDWRGLVGTLMNANGEINPIWFSEPEASIPFQYYFRGEIDTLPGAEPPSCQAPCWWVVRQPYTAPHAFSQAVSLPDKPWLPSLPDACQRLTPWETRTGLALWRVDCR